MKTNTASTAGKHSHNNIIAKGLNYSLNVVAKPHIYIHCTDDEHWETGFFQPRCMAMDLVQF